MKRGIIGTEAVSENGGNEESRDDDVTSSARKRTRLVSEADEANPYEDMD